VSSLKVKKSIEKHIMGLKFTDTKIETEDFVDAVLELEKHVILDAVKSAGRTIKQPSVAYRYRINKHRIMQQYRNRLNQDRLEFHHEISLDYYYSLSQDEYERDRPWIKRIDGYLKEKGLPSVSSPAPERSHQLIGNELMS
jgi:hypothetical protein